MIPFVYFDVGGTLMKDFSKTDKWHQFVQSVGISGENEKNFTQFWTQSEKELSVGREMSTMIPEINKLFSTFLPLDYNLLREFTDRFEMNKIIWPIVAEIRQKCRVGLLTNMYAHMLDAIYQRGIMPPTKWDIIIDSSIVRCAKPGKEIYELAQEKAGVPNEE